MDALKRMRSHGSSERRVMAARENQLAQLAEAAARCPLYRNAAQVAFGEGPVGAPIVTVLRMPDETSRREALSRFVTDLRQALVIAESSNETE